MPDVPAGGEVTASGRDARRALGPAWDEAWQASHGATIFQSSGWYLSWLDALGHQVEPIVLRASSSDGSLVGVALQWDASTSTISPLSSPWADYHDVIGAIDHLACTTLADALAGLANEGARIELNEVRQGSALARVARQAGLRSSRGTPTHAIDLRNSATVRRILDRREHVTKMRRLHRIGDVKLVHHTQGPTINERLRRFITMHQTQWSGRPDAVAPFDGGAVDEFFRQLTARCSGAVISELTVEGEPIAMRYGFLWNRTYSGYRPTFALAMQRFSPGLLHLRSMVDDFAHRGLHRLDLMRGDHKHKARFADVRNESLTFATGADVGQPEA
jgi:CelD/BcsL family acetyltransferase involved in cellulose biosynthesis